MKRQVFITAMAATLALPSRIRAQRPARLPVLGMLSEFPDPTPAQISASPITRMLAELGWIEGKTLVIERRGSAGQRDRLPGLAADLVSRPVDVIWTLGPRATTVATQATKSIPIVFVRSIALAETGCSQALARPDGNCTGVTSSASMEVYAKPIEVLREIKPAAKRVTAIGERTSLTWTFSQPLLDLVTRNTGIEVEVMPIAGLDGLDAAFARMSGGRTDAVYVHATELMLSNRQHIAELALRQQLPSLHDESIFVDVGGLLSYGSDLWATIRQSLSQVDRILRGAKPRDVPVEQPTRFDLVINLKTARALNLKIPPAVLVRAERLVE